MNAKAVAALTLLLLTGCATTPPELVQEAKAQTYTSKQEPEFAAGCMARNLENKYGFVVIVRRSDKTGAYQVIVRSGPGFLLAYSVVEPQDSGSKATLWVSTHIRDHEQLAATTAKGC